MNGRCEHCGQTLPHVGTSWKESGACRRAGNARCDYIGPMTGMPCANPDAEPHAHYTAASDCPDRHASTEPNGDDQ